MNVRNTCLDLNMYTLLTLGSASVSMPMTQAVLLITLPGEVMYIMHQCVCMLQPDLELLSHFKACVNGLQSRSTRFEAVSRMGNSCSASLLHI